MTTMGYDFWIFERGDIFNPFFVFLCFSVAASVGERFVRRGHSFLARRLLMTSYLLVTAWVFVSYVPGTAKSLYRMASGSDDWLDLASGAEFVLMKSVILGITALLVRLFWSTCPEVAISNVRERGDRAVTIAGCSGRAFFFAFFGMGFLTESITAPIERGTPLTWDAGHLIKLAVYLGCAMFVLRRYLPDRNPHKYAVVLRSPLEGRGRRVATTIVGCWVELMIVLVCLQLLFALPSIVRMSPVDRDFLRGKMDFATCQMIQNMAVGILLLVLAAEDYVLVRKLCRGDVEDRVF